MPAKLNADVSRIHKIMAVFYTVIGLFVLCVFILPRPGDAGFLWIAPVLPVVHAIAAIGCAKGAEWGRVASIALGLLLLFGFPIGTLIGATILFLTIGKDWQDGAQTSAVTATSPDEPSAQI